MNAITHKNCKIIYYNYNNEKMYILIPIAYDSLVAYSLENNPARQG